MEDIEDAFRATCCLHDAWKAFSRHGPRRGNGFRETATTCQRTRGSSGPLRRSMEVAEAATLEAGGEADDCDDCDAHRWNLNLPCC